MTRRVFLLAGVAPPAAVTTHAYRADATILLLGIPILSRRGVGNGSAGYGEHRSADGRRLNLSFAGGSWPERAAGVVKFGAMEEESRFSGGAFREADYFGLITSSPEQSYSEARKARDETGGAVTLAVVEGVVRETSYRWRQAWFKPTGQVRASTWQALTPQGRGHLAAAALAPLPLPPGAAPPPFLTAIVQCLERSEVRQDVPFVYAGGLYRLVLQREADPKAGESLARRIAGVNAARVLRFSGQTRRDGSTRSKFRLWIDPTRPSPVPLRIEIQPRMFLRLSFELDPAAASAPPRAGLFPGIVC